MFLITSRNSTFIRGVLIWQLNYFYHKVDVIRYFERKHETEVMGQRSKPVTIQSFLRGIPDWKREAGCWHFFQQLMKISQVVKPSNSLEEVMKSHFRLAQSSQQWFTCMQFALCCWYFFTTLSFSPENMWRISPVYFSDYSKSNCKIGLHCCWFFSNHCIKTFWSLHQYFCVLSVLKFNLKPFNKHDRITTCEYTYSFTKIPLVKFNNLNSSKSIEVLKY